MKTVPISKALRKGALTVIRAEDRIQGAVSKAKTNRAGVEKELTQTIGDILPRGTRILSRHDNHTEINTVTRAYACEMGRGKIDVETEERTHALRLWQVLAREDPERPGHFVLMESSIDAWAKGTPLTGMSNW